MKNILLINPWIYDFAAYDLWLKPWGLLKLSTILKEEGFNVSLVDVVDRHHQLIDSPVKDSSNHTGKYLSQEVVKPSILSNIPRTYRRYGLPIDLFEKALPQKKIDVIFVSSGMTYWYPGVFKAIELLKEIYPNVKIILGGPYATLANKHAVDKSGADIVISNFELQKLSQILDIDCDFSFQRILNEEIDYSSYRNNSYGVLRVSLGCPFNCSYCAQKKLGPFFMHKNMKKAIQEYDSLSLKGLRVFAFYDDALLFEGAYIKEYLRRIIAKKSQSTFYTPNGLHARFLTEEIAVLLKGAGFINPTLSLETAQDEETRKWHNKVTRGELAEAVSNLRKAGYAAGEYMVYLLLGVPGSKIEAVEEDIEFVHSLGAKISLSEFSPIPGTEMGEMFKEAMAEPLLQNNSVFPAFNISDWNPIKRVKEKAVRLNRAIK